MNHPWKIWFSRICLAGLGLCFGGISGLLYFESQLPSIKTLEDYRPNVGTKIYSNDGHLVAFLATERRTIIPINVIPAHVKNAFLAAEDTKFYEHKGLDYLGILRAFMKNLRPGAHLQGASTITQQTVKTLIVGPERSYSRKIREALLSRQLEQLLNKDEILHLYLNQIYFGLGSHGKAIYGIEEASQNFFGKSVLDLDINEASLLSCVPKNPGKYTVLANPNAAKKRQAYVLKQMVDNKWATEAQAKEALHSPLPRPQAPPPYLGKAPHYVTSIRRRLIKRYGENKVLREGLTVYTGINAPIQWTAHQALREGLETLTKRQGFSGATRRIEVDSFEIASKLCHQALTQRLEKRRSHPNTEYANEPVIWDLNKLNHKQISTRNFKHCQPVLRPLKPSTRVTTIVESINPSTNEILVDLGTTYGSLSFESLQWARTFSPETHTPKPRSATQILERGDLIEVRVLKVPKDFDPTKPSTIPIELIPAPKLEGAIVVIEPHSRQVKAIVGGYSLDETNLLRSNQALRQPGSAFKPIIYAAGIESKTITPASICSDSPVVIRDPWSGKAWKPQNYEDGRYDGNITYRVGLSKSKNTCSVKLVEALSPKTVIRKAHAMGIHTKLPNNLTIALGTGEVIPLELANSYATVASGGYYADPIFMRKVIDSRGEVLFESKLIPKAALSPEAAFIVSNMMTSVVAEGTARRAQELGRPLAGKTGTTNQSRDTWFGGFSPQLVALVWVGFDDNSSMGKLTGSSAALPIWTNLMKKALKNKPPLEFKAPETIVFKKINRYSGIPTEENGNFEEVFIPGTEPRAQSNELPSLFIEDE